MRTLLALLATVRFALGLPSREQQIKVIAAVLWAEARSEGTAGIDAVARVIYNRSVDPRFPEGAYNVVTQPRQFACLDHISAPKLISRASNSSGSDRMMWCYCRVVARELATGSFGGGNGNPETPGKPLFFFSGPPPDWATQLRYVSRVGHHRFFGFYE